MKNEAKWTSGIVIVLGLAMSCSLSQAAVLTNGGFESGSTGWTVDQHEAYWIGEVVTMGTSPHPNAYEGVKSFYGNDTGSGGKSLKWSQSGLDVSGQWSVTAASYLTAYTSQSFISLVVDGFNGGTKKITAAYWRGGANFGYHTDAPTTSANFYKMRIEAPNSHTTGQWVDIVANVPVDFDAEFNDPSWGANQTTFAALGVDTIKLTLQFWDNAGTHDIEGYFDNVQLVPEPATMAMLVLGLPLAALRRRRRKIS